jgi:prepilin-type N-terminal cleavage/methylation domain-containing protein
VIKKRKPSQGFSIIELSISLLVIAIIMSGIAGSVKMISSARITNARSLTLKSPVPKIDGLVAWYETSSAKSFNPAESIDDAKVTTWYDISPNSVDKQRNVLTKTSSSSALYQVDGIGKVPSIYFDGTANGFSLMNFYQGSTRQNTIFIVAKPSYLIAGHASMMVNSNCTLLTEITATSFLTSGVEIHIQNVAIAPAVIQTNKEYILSVYYNGTSSRVYMNDAVNMLGGSNLSVGSTNSLRGLSLGGCGPWFFSGWISEVIIYNHPLQNQERKDVMNYLSQKYDIAVNGI